MKQKPYQRHFMLEKREVQLYSLEIEAQTKAVRSNIVSFGNYVLATYALLTGDDEMSKLLSMTS